MAKRFVDTSLFDKAWFRKLPPKIKCLWEYVRLKCDQVGVLDVDLDLVSFQVGEEITIDDFYFLKDHIVFLSETKILVKDFIHFQYGTLSENCNPHKPIIALAKKHLKNEKIKKIFEEFLSVELFKKELLGISNYSKEGYLKGIEGVSGTLEDNTRQEKEKEYLIFDDGLNNDMTIAHIIDLYNKILGGKGKIKRYPSHSVHDEMLNDFLKLIGFPEFNTREKIKNYFNMIGQNQFLRGDKNGFVLYFAWAIKPKNALDFLSGKHDERGDQQSDASVNPFSGEKIS
jgi:hypothetical protein